MAAIKAKKVARMSDLLCGANGSRTSDTRIFSPLLYQLSYGTFAFGKSCYRMPKSGCKGTAILRIMQITALCVGILCPKN